MTILLCHARQLQQPHSDLRMSSILVGDHLGQVKKVFWTSGEVCLLPNLAEPSRLNPIVSIDPFQQNQHLIASKDGSLYIFNSIKSKIKRYNARGLDNLVRAAPLDDKVALIYEKNITIDGHEINQKKGRIRNAKANSDKLALVGKDIPLRIFDTQTKSRVFQAEMPDKNWLNIQPDCEVVDLDFVAGRRVATCSKSDSIIRVYDTSSHPKPVITVDIKHTAFNEYAEAGRFMSVASTDNQDHKIVVGSNVGQMIAIDLRFKKVNPKKRLQPKTSKILGSFKGSRGATIKDIKIINAQSDYKVVSCCLDRYLRIHNFSGQGRQLEKQIYMKTKPLCCSITAVE